MKKIAAAFVFFICYQMCFSQCSVHIDPAGPLFIQPGDSVALHASASSPVRIDQQDTVYSGGTSARTLPGYRHFQTFTAGITGVLRRIDLGFFNPINGQGELAIFEGAGTSGAVLDASDVGVFCGGGNCTFSYTTQVLVTAGNMYTIGFTPFAGSMPDPYGVQVDAGNSYSGGDFYIVDPSGTYNTGMDMVFSTWVEPRITYSWSTGSSDSSVVAHSAGWYTIVISDAAGCSTSDSMEIIDASVGIHETETLAEAVCIHGNRVFVNAAHPIRCMTLYAADGRMLNMEYDKQEFSLEGYPRGLYFLLVEEGSKRKSIRFIY